MVAATDTGSHPVVLTSHTGEVTTSTWQFDDETAIDGGTPLDSGSSGAQFTTRIDGSWNIGHNPNGGYALSPSLRAMSTVLGRPDPMTVTTHFLRPCLGDEEGSIEVDHVRSGRLSATATATMNQGGKERLRVLAAFGDLSAPSAAWEGAPELSIDPIELPPPDECRPRIKLEQGVDLPIMSRLDVRIDPRWAEPGRGGRAEVSGWIRFVDGRPVDTMALPLFADAFPPPLFSLLGRVGWVPTLELTVQVRRRPVDGWIRARFRTRDLTGGTFVEDGELWDESDRLVARSRQMGVLLGDGG